MSLFAPEQSYYSLSDKYIIKVAEDFQLIISLYQLEYTFTTA